MTFNVLWTTVPGGIDPTNPARIRLSLIASPRIEGQVSNLGASELADWPARVRNLGPLAVQIQGQPTLLPATVTSAAPSSQVWSVFSARLRRCWKRSSVSVVAIG